MQTNCGTELDRPWVSGAIPLRQWVADAHYEKRVFDIVARTKTASDDAEVLQWLDMGTKALGAESGVLMLFRATPTHPDEVQIIGGDPTWGAQYFQADGSRHDVAIEHTQRRGTAVAGDVLELTTAEQKAVVELAIRHGWVSRYVAPACDRARSRQGFLLLGSSVPNYFAESPASFEACARALADVHYRWWIDRIAEELRTALAPLTPDQHELLRDLGQGNSKTIAKARGVSSNAIDSRVQRLLKTMHFKSRRELCQFGWDAGCFDAPASGKSSLGDSKP